MSDKDEIVARFTPHSDGAYLRGVPNRDLTQRDIDAMTPTTMRDAFAPHPLYGTPLYTRVDASKEQAAQERAVAAIEKAAEQKDGSA